MSEQGTSDPVSFERLRENVVDYVMSGGYEHADAMLDILAQCNDWVLYLTAVVQCRTDAKVWLDEALAAPEGEDKEARVREAVAAYESDLADAFVGYLVTETEDGVEQ